MYNTPIVTTGSSSSSSELNPIISYASIEKASNGYIVNTNGFQRVATLASDLEGVFTILKATFGQDSTPDPLPIGVDPK